MGNEVAANDWQRSKEESAFSLILISLVAAQSSGQTLGCWTQSWLRAKLIVRFLCRKMSGAIRHLWDRIREPRGMLGQQGWMDWYTSRSPLMRSLIASSIFEAEGQLNLGSEVATFHPWQQIKSKQAHPDIRHKAATNDALNIFLEATQSLQCRKKIPASALWSFWTDFVSLDYNILRLLWVSCWRRDIGATKNISWLLSTNTVQPSTKQQAWYSILYQVYNIYHSLWNKRYILGEGERQICQALTQQSAKEGTCCAYGTTLEKTCLRVWLMGVKTCSREHTSPCSYGLAGHYAHKAHHRFIPMWSMLYTKLDTTKAWETVRAAGEVMMDIQASISIFDSKERFGLWRVLVCSELRCSQKAGKAAAARQERCKADAKRIG